MNDETVVISLLRQLVELEAAAAVDWDRVAEVSLLLVRGIASGAFEPPPHAIYHYIDDWDIRKKDRERGENQYSDVQTARVLEYLNSHARP